jgi:hypothetical protein
MGLLAHFLLQERIADAFMPQRRNRAVTGQKSDIIAQRQQFRADSID